jgi:hypothetical protein
MKFALLIMAIGLVWCSLAFAYVVSAKAITVSDPWTVSAATFNPKGVKWSGGVTNGNELIQVRVWSQTEVDEIKAGLDALKQ